MENMRFEEGERTQWGDWGDRERQPELVNGQQRAKDWKDWEKFRGSKNGQRGQAGTGITWQDLNLTIRPGGTGTSSQVLWPTQVAT